MHHKRHARAFEVLRNTEVERHIFEWQIGSLLTGTWAVESTVMVTQTRELRRSESFFKKSDVNGETK